MDAIQLISLAISLEIPLGVSPPTPEDITNSESHSISIYHPLRLMHIRVLDILPVDSLAPDSDNALVRAKIRVIDLQNEPIFTALSYVWGNFWPEPDFILCEDVKVNVSINCKSALINLRRKLGNFCVWVDAVCINQKDGPEKEQQIPLMCKIYTLAQAVYIWLGEGTSETDRAMAYMVKTHFGICYNESTGQLASRPYATAWKILTASISKTRHPLPLKCKLPNS